MYVLMKLKSKNNNIVSYEYGNDENNLNGIIEVDLKDFEKYRIIKESNNIGTNALMKAYAKLIKCILKGKIPEIVVFAS